MPQGWDWFYLIMIGVLTQLGQINLTKALQLERIADVSIYNYLGVIYALIYGIVLFNEHYGWAAVMGIGLVLFGVLLNFFYTKKQHEPDNMMSVEE